VAPHPASQRRSYLRLPGAGISRRRTFTSQIAPADRRTMGVRFNRTREGRMIQVRMLGHSRARSCESIGGGRAVVEVLRGEALRRDVRFIERTAMVAILAEDGSVTGALAFPVQRGTPMVVCAPALVVAAGGATGLFSARSASFPTTSVGPMAALDAGASLANLEFIEFSLVPAPGGKPLAAGGINPFLGRGGRLFNALGERIMERVDPERLELADRSLLVETVAREYRAGRGPVVVDPAYITRYELCRWESMKPHFFTRLRNAGVDPTKDRMPWVVAIHSSLGGIVAGEQGATGVHGLYAAGESITGFHGCNRLGSNALTACVVMGTEAGRNAALSAMKRSPVALRKGAKEAAERFVSRRHGGNLPAREYLRRVRETADLHLNVPRNKEGLVRARAVFADLATAPPPLDGPEGAVPAVECAVLARLGCLTAEAALMRTESRGQHVREDCPHQDPSLERWFVAVRKGEEVQWSDIPVPGIEHT
ncbi:MAG: FAD-binding protein, partial [Deltaproteobacteria bacterium]|nr:FAD-binding protein [Deltaproteobacteria bacterium]